MMKFFSDCFTGVDNQTYDLGRVVWAMCFFVWGLGGALYLALEAVAVLTRGDHFDMVSFGAGFASLVVTGAGLLPAGGFGLKLKAGTEPKPLK